MTNNQIGNIMINEGSFLKSVFKKKKNLLTSHLTCNIGPLYDFFLERSETERVLALQITWGEGDCLYIALANFYRKGFWKSF